MPGVRWNELMYGPENGYEGNDRQTATLADGTSINGISEYKSDADTSDGAREIPRGKWKMENHLS